MESELPGKNFHKTNLMKAESWGWFWWLPETLESQLLDYYLIHFSIDHALFQSKVAAEFIKVGIFWQMVPQRTCQAEGSEKIHLQATHITLQLLYLRTLTRILLWKKIYSVLKKNIFFLCLFLLLFDLLCFSCFHNFFPSFNLWKQ